MAEERRTSAATRSGETPVAELGRVLETHAADEGLDVDLGPWGAPSAIRTPYYGRVREAWRAAVARHDYSAPQLAVALQVFARDARAREIPVSDLLKALDAMIDARYGGEYALDADHVRTWAGLLVTRAYYRDD